MLKKDLLNLIVNVKDEEDIDSTLKDSELVKKFSGLDSFKEKTNSDKDFKAFMDSEKDKHLTKSLETWKSNNLQGLIDEEIKKRFPDKDPKDLKLQELEIKLKEMEKETLRKELTNKALKSAQEKKLPAEIIDYFIGNDEESTNKNLTALETSLQTYTKTVREEILKEGSYTPPNHDGNKDDLNNYNPIQLMSMGYSDKKQN